MVLTIKNRISYYKRFGKDIWGIIKTSRPDLGKGRKAKISPFKPWYTWSNKIKRIFDFFINNKLARRERAKLRARPYVYRLDIIHKPLPRSKLKKRFISLRLVKFFYINLSYRQFRVMAKKIRRKQGMFEWNFLLALEGRLLCFLYRAGWSSTMFSSITIIRQGYVSVEQKATPYINHKVKLGDFVTFTHLGKRVIYLTLLYRLKKKIILFNPPPYMYISYKLLFTYFKRPPIRKYLIFPVAIDLYRATGYAF